MTDRNHGDADALNLVRSTWAGLRPEWVNELLILKQALADGIDRLPATGALYRAYIPRVESWIAARDNAPERWTETEEALNREILELRSWIVAGLRGKKESRPASADKLGVILNSAGFLYPQTRKLAELPPSPRGRPAGTTSRELYLTACDLWLGGNWSYPEITNRLCECDALTHAGCEEKFRKGIKAVRKLLRKYNLTPQQTHRADVFPPTRR
jgi:hypothetical protein